MRAYKSRTTVNRKKMNKTEWLCLTCRFVRMSSGGTVTRCATIGYPELAYRYGKCRKYQPKQGNKNETNGK